MSKPRLSVWMYDTLVAQIEVRGGNELRLRHTKDALERWPINTSLISCSLPVARSWTRASIYLRGLLPEGQHLLTAAAAAGVTTADTYGLLARYGRDVAGAMIITRHDEEPDTTKWGFATYDKQALGDAVDNLSSDNPVVPDDSELSIAGLQNKTLLVRQGDTWARPTGGRPSTHILKINDPRHPGLVEAEHAALQLAQDIGLTTTNPMLESINGRDCIIVERYDRTITGKAITRIHQEDSCQALGINHETNQGRGKYESAGGPSYLHIAELLYENAENPDTQVSLLARYMTYTRMIGNADAHGKNIAFLHDQTGNTQLTPLYDTVPTILWPKLRTQPAMSIGNASALNNVTRSDLLAEAERWPGSKESKAVAIAETLEAIRSASVSHEDLGRQIDTAFNTL